MLCESADAGADVASARCGLALDAEVAVKLSLGRRRDGPATALRGACLVAVVRPCLEHRDGAREFAAGVPEGPALERDLVADVSGLVVDDVRASLDMVLLEAIRSLLAQYDMSLR